MKRLYYVIALGLSLAACATDPNTSEAEQAASSGDCYGTNNFPNAKLQGLSSWDGSPTPALAAKQTMVTFQMSPGGDYLAAIADLDVGKIVWARTVSTGKIAAFFSYAGTQPAIWGGHIPPPPTPTGDPWGFRARLVMEIALRNQSVMSDSVYSALNIPH